MNKSCIPNKISIRSVQCGASYSEEKSLEKHIMVKHLDVKLECGKCERRYSHQSELKMHEKSAHEGMRFICSKECPSKKTLLYHCY